MKTEILRTELLAGLKTSTMMVKFTKKNGEVRDMTCTLQESMLPARAESTVTRTPSSTDSISVFDTDKSAWRAFNLSSVISYSAI